MVRYMRHLPDICIQNKVVMDFIYETSFWLWLWVPISVIIITGLLWLWWSERKQAREYLSLIVGLRKANDEWKKDRG